MKLKNKNILLRMLMGLFLINRVLLADINGTVFRDYNLNGIRDIEEVGVEEINVTLYSDREEINSTLTDVTGSYKIVSDKGSYRIEFSNIPSYLQIGTAINGKTHPLVSTVDDGISYSIGLNNPTDYSEKNSTIMVIKMLKGSVEGKNKDVKSLLKYRYGHKKTVLSTTLVPFEKLGSVYGMVYSKTHQVSYLSSWFKRYTGVKPNGIASIYKVDSNSGVVAFVNENGTDPRSSEDSSYDWNHDIDAYSKIGKIGFGDIELSDDDSTLFAVNLEDKKLYIYNLNEHGNRTDSKSYSIPNPCSARKGIDDIDFRPMGLGFNDGLLYVGTTCTAESTVLSDDSGYGLRTGERSKLSAHIYSFNPSISTFSLTPIVDIPLNYDRGCIYHNIDTGDVDSSLCSKANGEFTISPWLPWQMDANIVFNRKAFGNVKESVERIEYPQPLLADISFDNNDSMIIGIRDINGDRGGYDNTHSILEDSNLSKVSFRGDIIRACGNSKVGWSIENNTQCGVIQIAGKSKNQEFDEKLTTLGDIELVSASSPIEIGDYVWDDNNSNGLQEPSELGISNVVVELYDGSSKVGEARTNSNGHFYFGGITDSNMITGSLKPNRDYQLRIDLDSMGDRVPTQKGMGDNKQIDNNGIFNKGFSTISYRTGRAGESNHSLDFGFTSLYSLGNYIWNDRNKNGIQDSNEEGIADVNITLYQSSDCSKNLLGSMQTAKNGSYLFTHLSESRYCLKFTNFPKGYVVTSGYIDEGTVLNNSDGNSTIEIKEIALTTNDLTKDIGLYRFSQKASIGNYVWLDENRDGLQGKDEKGLANIVVKLLQECNGTSPIEIDRVTTDENGTYLFDGLDAGFYCLDFSELPSLINITLQDNSKDDNNDSDVVVRTGRTAMTELISGEVDLSWDMGLYYLFLDSTPTSSNSSIPTIASISGGGDVSMDEEVDYKEEESSSTSTEQTSDSTITPYPTTQPTSVSNSTPTPSPTSYSPSPSPSFSPLSKSLPLLQKAERFILGDRVWNDSNRNGIQDSHENGIYDVGVSLYETKDCQGDVLEVTKTNHNGEYKFLNLKKGYYCILFSSLPNNYSVTDGRHSNDINNSDANADAKIPNIFLVDNDLDKDMGLYSEEICEVSKVYDKTIEAESNDSTTIIDIFSNNEVALNTQTINLVRIKEGEVIYPKRTAISSSNIVKLQTLRVEGEGVWEVNGGSIYFTASNGFNGIPSPIHYVIVQSKSCITVLGEEGHISKVGEIKLTTPCFYKPQESKVEKSVPISNRLIIVVLLLTTAVAIFFVREEEID